MVGPLNWTIIIIIFFLKNYIGKTSNMHLGHNLGLECGARS